MQSRATSTTSTTSTKLTLSDVERALGKGRRNGAWMMFFCPVHPDGEKHGRRGGESLGFSMESGVLRCFNGCSTADVVAEIRKGLGSTEPLSLPRRTTERTSNRAERTMASVRRQEEKWEKVRTFEYVSPVSGKVLGLKHRLERPNPASRKGKDKRFVWELPDGRKLSDAGLSVADMPLYRADRIAQTGFAEPVWVVEGEKCVEVLEGQGQIATCLAGSASQRDFGAALDILFGRVVYIWPDNDREGREFARRLKRALNELDCDVRVVTAPVKPGEDAADYFAAGGTLDDLLSGEVRKVTVEVHAHDHIVIRIPASPHAVALEFERITRGRGELEAELTVSMPGEPDYWVRINAMSTSARESLQRSLKGFFDTEVEPGWPNIVAQAMKALREAYLRSGPVELLEGNATEVPAQFVVDGLVVERGGTILFGAPGRGKSQTALALAVSVDAGLDTVFPVRYPVPSLYINLERSKESMAARLARVNRALGLPESRPLPFLNARGKGLVDVAERVREAIDQYGIGFVVLDSISRAGVGDLNDNRTANQIVDLLNSFGIAWLGIGHTPRADESHLYGSVHQEAGADVMVAIATEVLSDELLCTLTITKSNDYRAKGFMNLHLKFGADGLSGITSSSVVAVDDPYSVIRDALRRGKATAAELASSTGLPRSIVEATLAKRGFVQLADGSYGIAAIARQPSAAPRKTWDERLETCWYCTQPTEEFTDQGVPVCKKHRR